MTKETGIRIEPITDTEYLRALLMKRWGDTLLMGGRAWPCEQVRAFRAVDPDGELLGFVSWNILRATAMVFTLDSHKPGRGIGVRLLDAVAEAARREGAKAIRVMTTNDNTPALFYYQKLGFQLVGFFPAAVDIYRAVAPHLPTIGHGGLPIRDTLELEKAL
jgi:ribosomal protein S18 acetylase RimI-like enzyme